MATLVVQQAPIRQSRTPPPLTTGITIDTLKLKSAPIPNKHIPYCSPGPVPSTQIRTLATPPTSPATKLPNPQTLSKLYPPDRFDTISDSPKLYSIDASELSTALAHMASQPLPETKHVFPWLHGLHPDNQIQLAFFLARRKALRRPPRCLRGITLVKAGGDLSKARLKGALSPSELLSSDFSRSPTFLNVDPRDGFSVRNFQIQAAKMAMVSDIVVYKDDDTKVEELHSCAKRIAAAQKAHREACDKGGLDPAVFSTFVVSSKSGEHPSPCSVCSARGNNDG